MSIIQTQHLSLSIAINFNYCLFSFNLYYTGCHVALYVCFIRLVFRQSKYILQYEHERNWIMYSWPQLCTFPNLELLSPLFSCICYWCQHIVKKKQEKAADIFSPILCRISHNSEESKYIYRRTICWKCQCEFKTTKIYYIDYKNHD